MEKDVMLRSRMSAKQMEVLDRIVLELQAQTPEANVSTSSVARYALEKYVDTYIAKRDETKLFAEINISEFIKKDFATLYKSFNGMYAQLEASESKTVAFALQSLGIAITNLYAYSMRPKKGE